MRENLDVINTAVVPLVAMVCIRKQEVGGVIDSFLGVDLCCVRGGEGELERASWVLWFNGAAYGEVRRLVDPVDGGRDGDRWLKQQICRDKGEDGADRPRFVMTSKAVKLLRQRQWT